MTKSSPFLPIGLCVAFVVVAAFLTREAPMSDLLATWLAGYFYGAGDFAQIYPADTTLYTMLPPTEWEPLMRSRGYEHDVFPFIYPPLWAAAAAPIAQNTAPESVFAVARILNPAFIALMVWLAARATRTSLPLAAYLAIGIGAIWLTNVGQVGLLYGQPQIFVSFLTVFAVERLVRGGPATAGAIMALAAALKLYPALYAMVWLLSKAWKPLVAFVGVGLALAGLSVALAGWPLHAAFLHQVATIGDTVLLTRLNFSLDPIIGQIFMMERFEFVTQDAASNAGWFITAKGPLWSAISFGCLLASTLVCARLWAKTGDPMVWPLLMILGSLFTPLSWVYHYLAPMAFAPALLSRLGTRAGGLLLLGIVVPQLLPVMNMLDALDPLPLAVQAVSAGSFALLAVGCLLAILRGEQR